MRRYTFQVRGSKYFQYRTVPCKSTIVRAKSNAHAHSCYEKHTASYNIGFSKANALFREKLARKWGHAIARGWEILLLHRLRDFVVVPSSNYGSAGGNSSFVLHSQSTEERVTLDR